MLTKQWWDKAHSHGKKKLSSNGRDQRVSGKIQRKLAPEEIILTCHPLTHLTSSPDLKIKNNPQEPPLLRSRFADAGTGSNGNPTGPSVAPNPGTFKVRRGTCWLLCYESEKLSVYLWAAEGERRQTRGGWGLGGKIIPSKPDGLAGRWLRWFSLLGRNPRLHLNSSLIRSHIRQNLSTFSALKRKSITTLSLCKMESLVPSKTQKLWRRLRSTQPPALSRDALQNKEE